jgi:hypothetical protein
MYPATGSNPLASFAVNAQSQTRFAMQYKRVDQWLAAAAGLSSTQTSAEDVDLDGEDEYLLYNSSLFVMFEREGGRLVGAWLRDSRNGSVYQVMGNVVGYSGIDTEFEGTSNVESNGSVTAYRTSGLKDWWVGDGVDTAQYVNDIYSFSTNSTGWNMVSSDGYIHKNVTLADDAKAVEVQYTLSGNLAGKTLYVRNGFSPNLDDLLVNGQHTLGTVADGGGIATLSNTNYIMTVISSLAYADSGHSAAINMSAVDDDPSKSVEFDTVNMRNQAQTHQLEISGQGSFSFALSFGISESDWDGDGMPNTYEDGFSFLSSSNSTDGAEDEDSDGASNSDEYISGTGPGDAGDYLHFNQMLSSSTGIVVRFTARAGREYTIYYDNFLTDDPGWTNATPIPISVTVNGDYVWTDDGTYTDPDPAAVTTRFYKVDVRLAE